MASIHLVTFLDDSIDKYCGCTIIIQSRLVDLFNHPQLFMRHSMNLKLTLSTKVKYGLADLGFALITSAMQFFLLFYYTDVAGIDPVLAGSALMVGKLTWDAINDPLFGYWSDRTRSRFGRRRLFML